MARKKPLGTPVSAGAVRRHLDVTLAPATIARLERLREETTLPMGRLVDAGIARLSVCPSCDGCGMVDGELGPETDECPRCRGGRVV
jgi:hypothetical protein